MGKVFAQITPNYQNIISLEIDINTEENYPLLDKYNIRNIPMSVLINNKGQVVEEFTGVVTETEMESKLNKLSN